MANPLQPTLAARPPEGSSATMPARLHHYAYVAADQERTRAFYEDVLGFPLIAMWVESAEGLPGFEDRTVHFNHAFYALQDGGALAFFQFDDPEVYEAYRARKEKFFVHIALTVTGEQLEAIERRLRDADAFGWGVDHGYCNSIYAYDPDGLLLEFTVDPPNVAEIDRWQRRTAHDTLHRWSAGDRTANNDVRGLTGTMDGVAD